MANLILALSLVGLIGLGARWVDIYEQWFWRTRNRRPRRRRILNAV